MSQAPMPVPNGSGRAVRLGFNAGIQAAQTLCYGPDDPVVRGWSVAGMFWADSTNNIVKQLTQDGTTWVNVGTLNPTTGIVTWTNTTGITTSGASMAGALKFAAPIDVISASGVLTLTNASNSFIVSGTEAITSITGWTQGIVYLRWNTARTLTYGPNLLLQGGINRVTKVGDMGVYEVNGTVVREINYFSASIGGTQSAFPLGMGDYIVKGLKTSSITDLSLSMGDGTVVINDTPKDIGSSTISFDAKSVNYMYAKSDGTTGKIPAVTPLDYIDDNTIALWLLNQTTAGANIPNSAVNRSAIAIANDLVQHGGISSVDGWVGNSLKLDGTTGWLSSSNTTNFPSGAQEREAVINFTVDDLKGTAQYIIGWGSGSSATSFYLEINSAGLLGIYLVGAEYFSSLYVEKGETYTLIVGYVDGLLTFRMSGDQNPFWSMSATLSTGLSSGFGVGAYNSSGTLSGPCAITVHWVEIRNKVRNPVKTSEMFNKTGFPCFYDKSSAVYPTYPANLPSDLHEYKLDETSGTSVADSNTTNPLNGTATGTTIVDSPMGLLKARKFLTNSDYLSLGNFACGSDFFFCGVVTLSSTASVPLWSNVNAGATAGNMLYLGTDGVLALAVGNSVKVLGSAPTTAGKPAFILVSIHGTDATVYIDSIKGTHVTVPTLSTTSLPATIGRYNAATGWFMNGTLDYCAFGNFAPSQAEVSQIYSSLMTTGRRSVIDDIAPTSSVLLGFVRTNSTKIIEKNDSWYKYGRREKATGGNRRVFLPWTYFSGAKSISWKNPLGTPKYSIDTHFSQSSTGMNEVRAVMGSGDSNYGVLPASGVSTMDDAHKVNLYINTYSYYFNGAWLSSGYIGAYLECLEGIDS